MVTIQHCIQWILQVNNKFVLGDAGGVTGFKSWSYEQPPCIYSLYIVCSLPFPNIGAVGLCGIQ